MGMSLSNIGSIRVGILNGKTVKELAEQYKVSESSIRMYTKHERRVVSGRKV